MNHYTKHIFLCTNQKIPGKACCANTGGELFFDYLKKKLGALEMQGPGKCRISKSGCLGRCDLGPAIVIYPEGTWYTYTSFSDIDEIITTHLIENGTVERLLIK